MRTYATSTAKHRNGCRIGSALPHKIEFAQSGIVAHGTLAFGTLRGQTGGDDSLKAFENQNKTICLATDRLIEGHQGITVCGIP